MNDTLFKLTFAFVVFSWTFAIYYGASTVEQPLSTPPLPNKYTTTADTICKDWVYDERIGMEKRRVYEHLIRQQ